VTKTRTDVNNKTYAHKMPENFSVDTDPFYLASITTKRIHSQDEPWFMSMLV